MMLAVLTTVNDQQFLFVLNVAAFVWYRIIFIILTAAAAKNIIILYIIRRVYYIILLRQSRREETGPITIHIYNIAMMIIIVNCYFFPPSLPQLGRYTDLSSFFTRDSSFSVSVSLVCSSISSCLRRIIMPRLARQDARLLHIITAYIIYLL